MPKLKARGRINLSEIPYNGIRARPGCRLDYYVAGSGGFPHDMLRYDEATPANEADARCMDAGGKNGIIQIHAAGCTPERWKSFAWRIHGNWINEIPVRT